jgi:bisphosphoglycerate-independent phosphoglycerate mutase (AlkP superfamily)
LDELIAGIIERLDMECSLLVVIGDHGNFEDLSTPKHTYNPALGLLVGAGHQNLASRLQSLQDVTPALKAMLTSDEDVKRDLGGMEREVK